MGHNMFSESYHQGHSTWPKNIYLPTYPPIYLPTHLLSFGNLFNTIRLHSLSSPTNSRFFVITSPKVIQIMATVRQFHLICLKPPCVQDKLFQNLVLWPFSSKSRPTLLLRPVLIQRACCKHKLIKTLSFPYQSSKLLPTRLTYMCIHTWLHILH